MHYSALSCLDSNFRLKVYEFLREAAPLIAPSTVKVLETFRDEVGQNFVAETGKSKASFGNSPHNCTDTINGENIPAARAFDFGVFDENKKYVSKGADDRYTKLGQLAVALGLEWGGNWTQEKDKCEPDYDHIQQANWRAA